MPHPIHTIAALAAALVVQAAAGADVIGGATDIRPVITTTGNPADLWDLQDVKGSPFAYDFDDGTAATDTIGTILGAPQFGTGSTEVLIAPGDSGGPTFFNGLLIGVHSFGGSFGEPYDINSLLDSSFGELGGDTRIANYSGWIDSVTAPVPEPRVYALLLAGLVLVGGFCRRRSGPSIA